jgi:hypothetical protein
VFIYCAFDPKAYKEATMTTFHNLTDRALGVVVCVLDAAIDKTGRASISATQILWDLFNAAETEYWSRTVDEVTAS